MGLYFVGLVLVLGVGICWIWPRRGIKEQLKIFVLAMALALATAGLSWFGIWDWDGEGGGNGLAFLGLPLWLCVIGLHRIHSVAARLGLGIAAQVITCWVLVGVVWGIILAVLSKGERIVREQPKGGEL